MANDFIGDFDIMKAVPKFILADKNGFAMAKAIEAGLNYLNRKAAEAVKLITDVDTMPEWRLDELAWEYNIPYEYTASIDYKRNWIKNVYQLYAMCGTKEGIIQALETANVSAEVAEWPEYGGSPYHFRVKLTQPAGTQQVQWAEKIIDEMKPARSVLDRLDYEEA